VSTRLVRVPPAISLDDLTRLVRERIRDLQPDFPDPDVSTRWLVGKLREHNPDAPPRDLWTAAERYLADWHRGLVHPSAESQEPAPGSVADLADANRSLNVPRNPPIPQWW
jgi:hypothetical protein